MNFLLHRHLADTELGSPVAGIGAMLPDLWRMADRRVRARHPQRTPPDDSAAQTNAAAVSRSADAQPLDDVLAGIDHHLTVDRWFHRADVFVVGERRIIDRLHSSRIDAPHIGLFAHVMWEMCLDGALVRRVGCDAVLNALSAGLEKGASAADDASRLHHFDRIERGRHDRSAFRERMDRMWRELTKGTWIAGYQDGRGLTLRVAGVRAAFGLPRLSGPEEHVLSALFDGLQPDADLAVDELLGSSRR
jgi:hypothetical protein